MAATPAQLGAEAARHAVGLQVAGAMVSVIVWPPLADVLGQRWSLDAIPLLALVLVIGVLLAHERALRPARR